MIVSTSVRLAGKTYQVAYTARARYLFEELAGYALLEMRSVSQGAVSDKEFVHLLVAGLEGYRARERDRRAPWTVDEVLDQVLGDTAAEERVEAWKECLRAVNDAFRSAADLESAQSAEGKARTG